MRFWRRTTNVDGVNTTTHERQITRLIIVASARITKMWRCHVKQAAFLHLFCFFTHHQNLCVRSVTITSRYACPLTKRKTSSCPSFGGGEAVNVIRNLRHRWSARRRARVRRETCISQIQAKKNAEDFPVDRYWFIRTPCFRNDSCKTRHCVGTSLPPRKDPCTSHPDLPSRARTWQLH